MILNNVHIAKKGTPKAPKICYHQHRNRAPPVAYPVVPGDCHDGLGENLEGR